MIRGDTVNLPGGPFVTIEWEEVGIESVRKLGEFMTAEEVLAENSSFQIAAEMITKKANEKTSNLTFGVAADLLEHLEAGLHPEEKNFLEENLPKSCKVGPVKNEGILLYSRPETLTDIEKNLLYRYLSFEAKSDTGTDRLKFNLYWLLKNLVHWRLEAKHKSWEVFPTGTHFSKGPRVQVQYFSKKKEKK